MTAPESLTENTEEKQTAALETEADEPKEKALTEEAEGPEENGTDESEAEKDEAKKPNLLESEAFQKRINKIIAEKKELQEKVDFYREKATALQGQIASNLPNLSIRGKSIYAMNDEEFGEAVESLAELEGGIEKVKTALRSRNQYLSMAKGFFEAQNQAEAQQGALWAQEFTEVQNILTGKEYGDPGLKNHLGKIRARWEEDLQDPYIAQKKAVTLMGKLEHTMAIIRELGIPFSPTSTPSDERPTLKAPVGTATGAKVQAGGTKTFTREQIDKMTTAEFAANEEAIMAAMSAGKIK